MKRDSSGNYVVTVVDGSKYTGLYAADGSINVIYTTGGYSGSYHKCGALYVTKATGDQPHPHAPDGSIYISDTGLKGTYKVNIVAGNVTMITEQFFSDATTITPASESQPGIVIGVETEFYRAGTITAIRYYRFSTLESTSSSFAIYDRSTQALLYSQNFTVDSAIGWKTIPLTTPLSRNIGDAVRTAVLHPAASGTIYYGSNPHTFDSRIQSTDGAIVATGCYYTIGASLAYPATGTFNNGNYGADLVFTTTQWVQPTPQADVFPLYSGKPDATTTGVPNTTTLSSVYVGDFGTTADGQVLDGLDVRGRISVKHNNVTVQNCRVAALFDNAIDLGTSTGAIVSHNELFSIAYGIRGAGEFKFNNIYGGNNHIGITGPSNVHDNYLHGLEINNSNYSHFDNIEVNGGNNVTISNNTIINSGGETSAVNCNVDFAPLNLITIDGNYCAGGGYTIYATDSASNARTNVTISNNILRSGTFGYFDITSNNVGSTTPTQTNNTLL